MAKAASGLARRPPGQPGCKGFTGRPTGMGRQVVASRFGAVRQRQAHVRRPRERRQRASRTHRFGAAGMTRPSRRGRKTDGPTPGRLHDASAPGGWTGVTTRGPRVLLSTRISLKSSDRREGGCATGLVARNDWRTDMVDPSAPLRRGGQESQIVRNVVRGSGGNTLPDGSASAQRSS